MADNTQNSEQHMRLMGVRLTRPTSGSLHLAFAVIALFSLLALGVSSVLGLGAGWVLGLVPAIFIGTMLSAVGIFFHDRPAVFILALCALGAPVYGILFAVGLLP